MTVELKPRGEICDLACTYCLPAGTPVLRPDGQWTPIDALEIGDQVVGFDEQGPGDRRNRQFRVATVTARMSRHTAGLRFLTSRGDMVCSPDHKWLDGQGRWRRAAQFRIGQTIRWVARPEAGPIQSRDYQIGYFSGVSLGDAMIGHWPSRSASRRQPAGAEYLQHRYRLALIDEPILDRVADYAGQLGFSLDRRTVSLGYGRRSSVLQTSRRSAVAAIESVVTAELDSSDFRRGFLSGFFDAEGSCGQVLRLHNKNALLLARVQRYLGTFGFVSVVEPPRANGCASVRIVGGHDEVLRFWALMAPAATRKLQWVGRATHGRAEILNIDRAPLAEMYDITTTTGTFVAAGFMSHNCYEQPMRDAGNLTSGYDLAAMKQALEREGQAFTLFGGEPLLTPRADLEELLRWGHERWGGSSIQTNGARLEPWHVELFGRYNVSVGLSIDGPDDLNDARWAGSIEKTRAATASSLRAIALLLAAGRPPGLIVTLSRMNAAADRLPRLLRWFRALDEQGVTSVNLHLLEVDSAEARDHLALTEAENIAALLACYDLQDHLVHLRFSTLTNLIELLAHGRSNDCVWGGCDPLTTPAVQGVDGTGQKTNCGRTNKDGIDWMKADGWAPTRTQVLYETPFDDGGCQGCRFFFACRGQCPGTALGGDWRNRTEHCGVWMALFERVEADLVEARVVPLSWPSRRAERLALEQRQVAGEDRAVRQHGDHWDAPHGYEHDDAGLMVHGDQGTTTTHGDHTDAGGAAAVPARNGFASVEAMDAAHEMVLAALRQSPPQGLVVDLGAGDGELLAKISREFGVKVLGLEADAARIPASRSWILRGDVADVAQLLVGYAVDTCTVSARRFDERPDLEAWTRAHCRQLLVYSYDEPRFARVEACRA